MLMAEAGSGKAGTKAPGEEDRTEARPSRTVVDAGASTVTLPRDVCGSLELREGRLVVAYGADLYDPQKDVSRLKEDARLVKVSGPGEAPLWALYAKAESPEAISLALYGAAMSELGKNNIEIRLVEEMR
jgi:hypothetical protein